MAPARSTPARSAGGTSTLRLVPQDPEWLHDFRETHDLLLAPYHAAWSARRRGVREHLAPPYPAGLEDLKGLDAPAALDAWRNVHRAFPRVLRGRTPRTARDPARRSLLRAPDGGRLVPLHPVLLDEADVKALVRVRRALRAGARARPSLLVTHGTDGSVAVAAVPGPGDYRGTVDRTVAVLGLSPDEDVELLAAALAPAVAGARPHRVDLSEQEHAAYGRFADRLAAAAMTGLFAGDRAVFRSRYRARGTDPLVSAEGRSVG
ncbi:hypothetical protein [Streptomyces asoensis]|uniref:hypothetical protein n=1 Tax=Streptomyces asoensis TaxID=249586 RepID=UPI0033C4CAF8